MKMRFLFAILLSFALVKSVVAEPVQLSEDDAKFMKQLMTKDELIRLLPKTQKGLSALSTIVSAVSSGPVSIALQWNQVAIKTWRLANTRLDKIAKASICDEIDLRIAYEGSNTEFFTQLYQARGCPPE